MLFIINIVLLLYFLTRNNRRLCIFICTLIFALFFFSSKDPFVGIPLYFYNMLLSICLCFDGKSAIKTTSNSKLFALLFIMIFFLLIQIVNLKTGENVLSAILINETSSDYMDITSHLTVPTLNFTVFKHFVFYIMYLLFMICNADLLKDKDSIRKCKNAILFIFKVMFVLIILECIVVNLLGGYNDRPIMDFIFSVESRQSYNWATYGFYSVCLWFTERSYIDCILVFYLILALSSKYDKKFIFWFLLSGLAVLCTGSSTGITIFLIFIFYFAGIFIIRSKNAIIKMVFLTVAILIVLIAILNPFLFDKIQQYLSYEEVYGSAYFRRQANEYGIEAISFSPLIGVGIGTIYCHSILIQTVANIGIIGFVLALIFHFRACGKCKISIDLFIRITIVVIICSSAYMIQEFTSPYFLCIFMFLFGQKEEETIIESRELFNNSNQIYI